MSNLPAPTEALQHASHELQTYAYANAASFELAQRMAKSLSASGLVPKDYQGNIANCTIALEMAQRIGASPLMVMQNLVIVHGRPTWSSQFLISTVNTCGRFSALRYEFFGEQGTDGWGCRAWAIEKATGEKLVGTDVTIAIAKKEGWYQKNGSKWQSIPQQMLMYRAGSWWTRVYAPELSMGLHTQDEAADFAEMKDVTPKRDTVLNNIAALADEPFDPATGEIIENTPAEVMTVFPDPKAAPEDDGLFTHAGLPPLPSEETTVSTKDDEPPVPFVPVPFVDDSASPSQRVADWDAWVNLFITEAGAAPSAAWLVSLKEKNEKPLANLLKAKPELHKKLQTTFSEMLKQLTPPTAA